jgi:peptide-methionine (S)-S-oxide reductase
MESSMDNEANSIVLGGGCFWCIEAVFDLVPGVEQVISGYSGGQVENPTYEAVCTGLTGHAEVVEVFFDGKLIDVKKILEIFFSIHDPTTLNRQGPDIGSQYRSIIFFTDPGQKEVAKQLIEEIDEKSSWPSPVVTEVEPAENFYVAEDYHQKYYERNGSAPYCRIMIDPKVDKFKSNKLSYLINS